MGIPVGKIGFEKPRDLSPSQAQSQLNTPANFIRCQILKIRENSLRNPYNLENRMLTDYGFKTQRFRP
ncbi:MAG: hypothetical protein ACI9FD_003926, partial [Gammaproteobacteria bacterium]